jgi:lipooligosaccharide transport system permease protein
MVRAAVTKTGADFSTIFRFWITPQFLFSGVFFPVSELPDPIAFIAWLTPLYHGVVLTRGLTLDAAPSSIWTLHVGYLLALVAGGYLFALGAFRRRLEA